MKWSVNEEWGMTSLTVGMWQEMQPVAGLTGQVGAALNRTDEFAAARALTTPAGWLPAWHDRHLVS